MTGRRPSDQPPSSDQYPMTGSPMTNIP
jgi:hypothetical protein